MQSVCKERDAKIFRNRDEKGCRVWDCWLFLVSCCRAPRFVLVLYHIQLYWVLACKQQGFSLKHGVGGRTYFCSSFGFSKICIWVQILQQIQRISHPSLYLLFFFNNILSFQSKKHSIYPWKHKIRINQRTRFCKEQLPNYVREKGQQQFLIKNKKLKYFLNKRKVVIVQNNTIFLPGKCAIVMK